VPTDSTTRSTILSNFNKVRQLASTGELDKGRVNRALGLALRKEPRPYTTSLTRCDCGDWTFPQGPSGGACKHQLSILLAHGIPARPPRIGVFEVRP
jgi:SWIM zinc finger